MNTAIKHHSEEESTIASLHVAPDEKVEDKKLDDKKQEDVVDESEALAAELQLESKISGFEQTMDQLASHVSETRESVEHVKDVIHMPKQYFGSVRNQVKRHPALAILASWTIAFGIGVAAAKREPRA